jgi:Bifunctional DNA primase/polymerase, N-terminal
MERLLSRVDFTAGALPYAERLGWKVLLLAPGRKLPFLSKAKGGIGVHDATSKPDQIRAWGRICPNGNIAVACGEASGIIVVDVDPRHGGDASLVTLAAKGRVLPTGPRQRTGNRGWHHLFKADPRIRNSVGRLGPGLDVKSTGGSAVVAPSWIGKSESGPGGPYLWEVSPFDHPVPRMPLWMEQMLCPPPPKPEFAAEIKSDDLKPLLHFVAASCRGQRNNRLHWAASRAAEMAARRQISAQSAGHRLVAAAAACGYVGPEVVNTIDSAFRQSGLRFDVQ